ncbi:MAG: response regulator transcription factor [Bacteroidota bacterium]|nr:MAG: response regulator transcription factor [Bacteroidota bacterium]
MIIDDEANSRNTLRQLLQRLCPDVEVLAEATQAEEGLTLIRALNPDLIFLDIEMPGKNGFDLISALQPQTVHVIFTTAFHQYAVKAFRFSAIDFLLKPIDPDELVSAVTKFRERQQKGSHPDQLNLLTQLWKQLNEKANPTHTPDQQIALSNQEGIHIVQIADIVWCEALGVIPASISKTKPIWWFRASLKNLKKCSANTIFTGTQYLSRKCAVYCALYQRRWGQLILSDGHEVEVSRRKKRRSCK